MKLTICINIMYITWAIYRNYFQSFLFCLLLYNYNFWKISRFLFLFLIIYALPDPHPSYSSLNLIDIQSPKAKGQIKIIDIPTIHNYSLMNNFIWTLMPKLFGILKNATLNNDAKITLKRGSHLIVLPWILEFVFIFIFNIPLCSSDREILQR